MAHILHQLADTAADLLGADADHHALRPAILRLLCQLLVCQRLLLSLTASSGHCDVVAVLLELFGELESSPNFFVTAKISAVLSYRRRQSFLAADHDEETSDFCTLHSNMSAFKKRKLNGATPSLGNAPPKVRPSQGAKPPAKKPAAKPAPRQAPESSDDDEDSINEEAAITNGKSTESNGKSAVSEGKSTPSNGNAPSTSLDEATAADADAATKTFADLGVREELCDACEALKFTTPTPIQAQAIPLALEGRDVIGLAETGSGKTAAFVLPILQSLLEKPQALFGLILAPTRELAYQISQQVDALGSIINVKCATLVGGMDMVPQAIALSKRPHIVVATPGMLPCKPETQLC